MLNYTPTVLKHLGYPCKVLCSLFIFLVVFAIGKNVPLSAMSSNEITSMDVYIALATSLACTLPMILDKLLEFLLIMNTKSSRNKFNLLGNALLMCILIPNFIMIFSCIPLIDMVGFYFLLHSRNVIVVCTVVENLNYLHDSRYLNGGLILSLITVLFGRLLAFSEIFTTVDMANTIRLATVILQTFTLIIQLIIACLVINIPNYWDNNRRKLTREEYLCNMYIISLLVMSIVLQTISCLRLQYVCDYSSSMMVSEIWLITAVFLVINACQYADIKYEVDNTEEALKIKQMYIRYVSHELRTPLNGAVMGLQVLSEDIEDGVSEEAVQRTIRDVLENCDLAVNILNNMLTTDSIESGNLDVLKSSLHVRKFLAECFQTFFVQARQLGVVFDVENNIHNDILIMADSNKLSQVFRNVAANAIKYNRKGGSVKVIVKLIKPEEVIDLAQTDMSTQDSFPCKLSVIVIDTGLGISLEDQARLFQGIIQFESGKLHNNAGAGLGLFIAKGILDAHGGSITVHSNGVGHGSTFIIELDAIVPKRIAALVFTGMNSLRRKPSSLLFQHSARSLQSARASIRSAVHSRRSTYSNQSSYSAGPVPTTANLSTVSPAIERTHQITKLRTIDSCDVVNGSNARDDVGSKRKFSNSIRQISSYRAASRRASTSSGVSDKDIITPLVGIDTFQRAGGNGTSVEQLQQFRSSRRRSDSGLGSTAGRLSGSSRDSASSRDGGGHSSPSRAADVSGSGFMGRRMSDGMRASITNHPSSNLDLVQSFDAIVELDDNTNIENHNSMNSILFAESKVSEDSKEDLKVVLLNEKSPLTDSSVATETTIIPRKKPRILIVDDAPSNRRLLKRLLTARAENCIESVDGLDAVNQMKRLVRLPPGRGIDIITMDFQMPEMDGPTATKEIRKLGFTGLILGVTGNALPDDVALFIKKGANEVLMKPLKMPVFDAAVEKYYTSLEKDKCAKK